ncbi:hypothetical protein [Brevibacillus massiliensis]|nr:hypothetical protein [Brevibacillus massiliensis]
MDRRRARTVPAGKPQDGRSRCQDGGIMLESDPAGIDGRKIMVYV